MAKQLIVSVNGREKKIAIIEDDKVTEFYIERGEQHQGIVGNIYKGIVTKILPGMQAAFVDMGLRRAGFLYVADVEPIDGGRVARPDDRAETGRGAVAY